MAKKKGTKNPGIVMPGAKSDDQLQEWLTVCRRHRTFTDRNAQARKGITRGGRGGSKRAAIASGF